MRKILVTLKRVVDYNVRVRVKPDGSGMAVEGLKMSVNPFDEIALEEALRMRERGEAGEILAVTIGGDECQQQLRTGLAMGADRALLVKCEGEVEPLAAAGILLEVIRREEPDIVIMGKQAIDDDCNQTGQMLATLWGRPQATFASELNLNGDTARVTREVDAGLEVLEVQLPALITTDLRLNEPRYIKLPDIMKARRKPLETLAADDLELAAPPALKALAYEPPAQREKGVVVEDVPALMGMLRERGFLN
ncbi:MAG: electron transfer flavoprotein subunit beta/FixA family protein [Gammaproteobacteria bacterium]|nr:electron transfer flavoprotein subunit beta/FixA family protein [Gammaproteobacteria bacterium]MYD02360.1 electron transfer flavoprotein subunit beta/FixA family protein [Gammaproteobacteria bacterium]MYI24824.1 electron transfer flavoprotein subunit beta/FixA family protein [Gammaproteobacteria bacterium]